MTDTLQSQAFDRVVRPHFDRLFRLAWRLTGSKPEAEDLFQELLIKAFSTLDQLVDIDEPGPWLARVMYNLFVDRHRRFAKQRMHVVDEGHLPGQGLVDLASDANPVADHERLEKFRRLEKALDRLQDEHRIVVLLHDTEGYKLQEIGALLGVPEGTVKSRLHRARARLRQILKSDGTLS